MSSSVGSTTQATAPLPTEAPRKPPESSATTSPAVPADTVQLSSAAQAALREATETPAETAKEANAGDNQAKRLQAKEAAAKHAMENSKHVVA